MTERIGKRIKFLEDAKRLYEARLILRSIQGGGAMSPTRAEIQHANEVVSEIKDKDVVVFTSAKIDDAFNENQGGASGSNRWWEVKIPK